MKNRNYMAAALLGAVLAFTGCAAKDTARECHSVEPEDLARIQELLGTEEEEETEGTEETETPGTEEEPADVPVCPGEAAGYFPAGNGVTDSYFTVASITDTDGRSDTVLVNADGQMLVLEMDTALAEALQACPVDIFLYPVMDSGDAEDGEIPEMSKEEQDDFLLFAIESWYDTEGKAKDFYSLLQDFEGSAGKTRKDFSAEETAGFVEELLEMLPEGTAAGIREQLEEKMEDYAGSAGRAVMASYLLFDAQGNALGELSAEGITSYGQEALDAIAGTMDQCDILMSAAPVSTLAEGACFVSGGQTLWNNIGDTLKVYITYYDDSTQKQVFYTTYLYPSLWGASGTDEDHLPLPENALVWYEGTDDASAVSAGSSILVSELLDGEYHTVNTDMIINDTDMDVALSAGDPAVPVLHLAAGAFQHMDCGTITEIRIQEDTAQTEGGQ